MDYSQLSDFEINKRVALSLGMRVAELDDDHFYGGGYHDEYPDTIWAGKPDEAWEQICYTHSPEEIMPLMIEHKISLSWTGSYWQALPPLSNHTGGVRGGKDDPLRTGAICFLKMMEAKA